MLVGNRPQDAEESSTTKKIADRTMLVGNRPQDAEESSARKIVNRKMLVGNRPQDAAESSTTRKIVDVGRKQAPRCRRIKRKENRE